VQPCHGLKHPQPGKGGYTKKSTVYSYSLHAALALNYPPNSFNLLDSNCKPIFATSWKTYSTYSVKVLKKGTTLRWEPVSLQVPDKESFPLFSVLCELRSRRKRGPTPPWSTMMHQYHLTTICDHKTNIQFMKPVSYIKVFGIHACSKYLLAFTWAYYWLMMSKLFRFTAGEHRVCMC